ncbi:hypothetical protein SH528x_006827 [Novipirellula sp. SH528]|uniref:hypothetical protein n=1 Tax=Novipirellula sp. SH528 TaxID=3454466 RepID=UPI003F9FADDB
MRKRTPASFAAIAMVCSATLVANVHAESDLDVLLDSLSFADAPLVGDNPTADQATQLISDVDQDAIESLSDRTSPIPLSNPEPADDLVPAPAPVPRSAVPAPVDMLPPGDMNMPAPIIAAEQSPMSYGMIEADAGCSCGHRSCSGGCARQATCEPAYICKPHEVPILPSSTLRQYFRGDPCSAHLWDGYALELQQHCDKHHKHIHNRCECNNRGQCESCVLGKRNLATRHHCDAGCDGAHR